MRNKAREGAAIIQDAPGAGAGLGRFVEGYEDAPNSAPDRKLSDDLAGNVSPLAGNSNSNVLTL